MRKIEAIIFDMDGVIFDTEPLHSRAWQSAMKSFGVDRPLDYYNQWIGIPDTVLGCQLHTEHPGLAPEGSFLSIKSSYFNKLLITELTPFDGLRELLPTLKERYSIGIATTSHKKDMNRMLEMTDFSCHFSITSCYEDVQNHKPHPAPYLLAAERLEIKAENCLALDDSPSGVKSANSAGMHTWGITSSFNAEDLSEADRIFESTREACLKLLIEN